MTRFIEKKTEKEMLYYFLVVTIVFLMLFTPQVFKIISGEQGGTKYVGRNGYVNLIELQTSAGANSVFLTHNEVSKKLQGHVKYYEICYYTHIKGVEGLKISVIDNEAEVLGTSYFAQNGSSLRCITIDELPSDGWTGFNCINCNAANNITYYRTLNSQDVFYNGSIELSTGISKETRLHLKSSYFAKHLIIGWLTVAGLFFMLWLIIQGINYIKGVGFDDWDL